LWAFGSYGVATEILHEERSPQSWEGLLMSLDGGMQNDSNSLISIWAALKQWFGMGRLKLKKLKLEI
jgi:hypothetical protein